MIDRYLFQDILHQLFYCDMFPIYSNSEIFPKIRLR